jgi:hypothetical protein
MKQRVFGDVIVFGRALTEFCSARFLTGWFDEERKGPDWWRWSDGKAQLQLTFERSTDALIQGEIFTLHQPNEVEVRVNGQRATAFGALEQSRPFPPVATRFNPGVNTVEFVSRNAADKIPPDPRPLAIALKNLEIRSAEGYGCPLR